MNDVNDAPGPGVQVGPIHYQILCAAGLLLIFLAQFDQGLFLGNLLVVCIGVLGILSKVRAGPLLLLFAVGAAQFGNHLFVYQGFALDEVRPPLHIRDLILAIGLVTFVAANYRLQSLWIHILPDDPRQRRQTTQQLGRWRRHAFEPVRQKRSPKLLTPQEIARFVLTLPLWALAGQAAWIVIARPWTLSVFQPRLHRLIALSWLLIVGLLVIGTILSHWRRRQMTRAAAQVSLQDTLWRETRREQRRIFRWLAWRKLHERENK
jgi:hypothetical protein